MTTTTPIKTAKTATAAMKKLTIPGLKKWASKVRPLIVDMLSKRAFAEVEKKRVAAYIAPVFARFSFVDDAGAAITDPELLYCCDDEAMCAAYYTACDAAHREHGFMGEAGKCPALVAAHETLKVEWAVLESMERFVGLDGGALSRTLEIRAKALELCAQIAMAGR